MSSILSIDQGTTGSTCLVVLADGSIAGRGYREISQHYPQPGWVEHDADEIFLRTREAAREAIAKAGMVPDAIGITNQRETIVVWERATGRPVSRAIVWQDRRTSERCAELALRAPEITRRTGLVLDPYSATIYSSSPKVFADIEALVAQGLPMEAAIERVAYPGDPSQWSAGLEAPFAVAAE